MNLEASPETREYAEMAYPNNPLDPLATQIVDAAFKIHKTLGPGLLETVYEVCMARELSLRNIKFRTQVAIPIQYEGVKLETGLRLDMLVEEEIIVELKAIGTLTELHEAQILTYLKLANKHMGFLINFNVPLIKKGIRRFIR